MSKTISLNHKQVEHIAQLVQLELSQAEIEKYAKELATTLDYIQNLKELNTAKVAATSQTTGIKNQFLSEALNEKTLSQDKALQGAPKHKNGYFQIKGFAYNK